jgi:predicted Rossmann fold nucleotide-binding protein DprA/Smf involved in DNA uptake
LAKNDGDLFERLRRAGVRKQVAKTLSGIGEGASNKAVRAARSAVSELRSLADEIERRLPSANGSRGAPADAGATAQREAVTRKRPAVPKPKSPAGARTRGARAPRGQNKAKILESLKAGPKTASEIAKDTGIAAGTVGSTLTKLAATGEVTKADRGYGLPS